jgi:hypothetical protein
MTPLDRITGALRGDRVLWPADTDWNDVLAVAERHGVAMLLARVVPNDVLRGWSRPATDRALQLARQLRLAVAALRAADIDVLPLKGPVLAVTAYGDAGQRGVSRDLDLVVRPRDFERAVSCLCALGYVRHEGAADPDLERVRWQREAHLLPATLPAVMIELHTALFDEADAARLPLEDVFARSRLQTIFGVPMRVMAAEDQVLYLCCHGARHVWSRLLWVCDLAAVIRRDPTLDWQAAASRAAAIDATGRLALGLHLARTLCDVSLPPPSVFVGGPPPRHTTALVARRMTDTSAGRAPSLRLLLASELAAHETLGQRLRYVRTHLTATPRDRAWIRLPPRLRWLYAILRPLRLLTRYGQAYELRR